MLQILGPAIGGRVVLGYPHGESNSDYQIENLMS